MYVILNNGKKEVFIKCISLNISSDISHIFIHYINNQYHIDYFECNIEFLLEIDSELQNIPDNYNCFFFNIEDCLYYPYDDNLLSNDFSGESIIDSE